jgi:hypothetical protein
MRYGPILVMLPFLSGCFAYGYPSVCRTPPLSVPEENVRAFRVVTEVEASGPVLTGPIMFATDVVEIPVMSARVESQKESYFAYYYLLFPFTGDRARNMSVLLYRPGYQTVAVEERPWWQFANLSEPEKVVWKEAPSLEDQEEALKKVVGHDLSPKRRNRKVLELAVQEYTRLAEMARCNAPGMAEQRTRLLAEAEKYAAQLREKE